MVLFICFVILQVFLIIGYFEAGMSRIIIPENTARPMAVFSEKKRCEFEKFF